MKKIWLFGDSIFKGITYSDEKQRYRVSAMQNFKKLEESGIEIQNFSKLGATIEYGYKILKTKLLAPTEDSTVFFEYGGNDCDCDWKYVAEHVNEKKESNVDIETFKSVYKKCIQYAKDCKTRVVLVNLVPIDAEKYMNWIGKEGRYANILRWLGDKSMLYRLHEYYNRAVEDIARETGCELLDLRSMFLLSHEYHLLMSRDGLHPSMMGYQKIENALTKFVLRT